MIKECGKDMPPDPLVLRKFFKMGGEVPKGCSTGYVHWIGRFDTAKPKQNYVSDASSIGRFWPAHYCETLDCWIADGPGEQYQEGKVIETFPLY